MSSYRRPAPVPDGETAFYWESTAGGKLSIMRCQDCGYYVHYPRDHCPACHSSNAKPQEVSGRGRVYSYTQVHRHLTPGFDGPLPYTWPNSQDYIERGLGDLTEDERRKVLVDNAVKLYHLEQFQD